MTERTVSVRARARLAVLAALAVLPASGCTADVWRDYAWPDPKVFTSLVSQNLQSLDGELRAPLPVLQNGLWWYGGENDVWFLHPAAGADVAGALLAEPELCQLWRAEIAAFRRYVAEEVDSDDARVALRFELARDALVSPVGPDDVSPAAERLLARDLRNAFLETDDAGIALQEPFKGCVQRMRSIDFGWLIDAPAAAHAASWVFVTGDGQPAAAADPATPAPGFDDDAPLTDRLALLAGLTLLVRVEHAGVSTIVRLRPDRLWLVAGMEKEQERFVHRSEWRLQRVPTRGANAPDDQAPRCPARLVLVEARWQRFLQPVWFDPDLLRRIALTPFAFALDVVAGPGVPQFLDWLTGKGGGQSAPGPGARRR